MKKRTINKSILKKVITLAIFVLLLSTVVASATNINKSSSKKNQTCKNLGNTLISSDTQAFILTTDYMDSSFSIINVDNPDIVETDIASIHADDEVRHYNGKVYVLNRWGYDLIEVFDAEDNFKKVSEFSTGTGTNPQDIAFISNNKAYVTCYDTTDLLIVNPTTGEHLGTINLSEYADDDGIPEMHKMVAFKFLGKNRVYVTIQRLDRDNWFAPTDKSYIVELDGDKDTVIRAIQLTQVNPSTAPILDGIHILVGETGSWFDGEDGGIERINIFTNEAEGFIISEADLGGNIVDFDIYNKYSGLKGLILSLLDHHLGIMLLKRNIYAIVSDMSFNTSLMSFNLKEQTSTELFSTEGYQLADLAINDKGGLYLADRTSTSPGIRIFDTKTGEQETSTPIDVGDYPPVHITFL
jgi:DNA-binding beta-propeller fold protein YncE